MKHLHFNDADLCAKMKRIKVITTICRGNITFYQNSLRRTCLKLADVLDNWRVEGERVGPFVANVLVDLDNKTFIFLKWTDAETGLNALQNCFYDRSYQFILWKPLHRDMLLDANRPDDLIVW